MPFASKDHKTQGFLFREPVGHPKNKAKPKVHNPVAKALRGKRQQVIDGKKRFVPAFRPELIDA